MKKYIFLDIDGVLNSDMWNHEFITKYKYSNTPGIEQEIDPGAMKLINDLVNKTGAEIIMSSSWRHNLEGAVRKLKRCGLVHDIVQKIDNGRIVVGEQRGKLIKDFLSSHDYSTYVIIDDACDILKCQKKYYVQTNPTIGFCEADYKKALNILGYEEKV